MNSIIITGNLGKNPEIKFTPDGKAIGNFSMAVGQRVKADGVWIDGPTIWFQVKFFGIQAEKIVDRFSKGDTVTVSGRFGQSHWTTKDGTPATSLEIYGSDLIKVERQKATQTEEAAPVVADDKAPF